MSEIKVGEYIRTKNGRIGKVTKIVEANSGVRYAGEFLTDEIIEMNDNTIYNRRIKRLDIVKHSKNIIDLIEVEDFANGYTVITVNYKEQYITTLFVNNFGEKAIKVLQDNEIKAILTKEQYELNCYRLEG